MTPISFITPIKNRTNIHVTHEGRDIHLKLFENNLTSLINLITPADRWEYIIVDFESTDVNMQEFINKLPKKENLTFVIHTLKEKFNKGKGLNCGMSLASHPLVFVSDADMIIRTRDIFNDIENLVVKQNKVLFPICWSYSNPEHTAGWKRTTGTGMVVQKKETVVKYIDNKKWGREDDINYDHYVSLKQAYRTYYNEGFIHQWHPEELRHIHYK
jgi:glycosyltransferase involved in cell wall biosynthesis